MNVLGVRQPYNTIVDNSVRFICKQQRCNKPYWSHRCHSVMSEVDAVINYIAISLEKTANLVTNTDTHFSHFAILYTSSSTSESFCGSGGRWDFLHIRGRVGDNMPICETNDFIILVEWISSFQMKRHSVNPA